MYVLTYIWWTSKIKVWEEPGPLEAPGKNHLAVQLPGASGSPGHLGLTAAGLCAVLVAIVTVFTLCVCPSVQMFPFSEDKLICPYWMKGPPTPCDLMNHICNNLVSKQGHSLGSGVRASTHAGACNSALPGTSSMFVL